MNDKNIDHLKKIFKIKLKTKLRILLYSNAFLFLFLVYSVDITRSDIVKAEKKAEKDNSELERLIQLRIGSLDGELSSFQERIYKEFTDADNLILVASKSKVEKEELHDAIIKATKKSQYPVVIINNSDVKYIKVNDFIEKTHLYKNRDGEAKMKAAIRTLSREKGVILVAAPAILTSAEELDYTDFLVDTYLKIDSSE